MLILILYSAGKSDFLSKKPKKGFEDLYGYFNENGIRLCRAPIEAFEEKKGFFRKAQFFDGENWNWKDDVVPEVVFDKSPFFLDNESKEKRKKISENFVFVNDLEISELMSDKWKNYLEFEKYYPKTVLVGNESDLKKIRELESERIILKPLTGSGGSGITVVEKEEFAPIATPFIAQEFIDVENPHDLRVIIADGRPFYSFVRTPKKGKYLANISQGGKLRVVDISEISPDVLDIISEVERKLSKLSHKLYAVDFMADSEGRYRILEMNSRPGIILEKEELEHREYFYDNLVGFFKNLKK